MRIGKINVNAMQARMKQNIRVASQKSVCYEN